MTPPERHATRRRHAALGRERLRPPAGASTYAPRATFPRPTDNATPPPRTSLTLRVLRYGLPGAIVLAGAVVMLFGTAGALIAGSALVGAGLATALVSWFYRIGVASDSERSEEDRARRYFSRYGRWP
jgi:hypothetical protein